jgi:hypothetical protein
VIGHVGGLPFEELFVPIILGASAFGAGVRALLAHRQGRRHLVDE